MRTSGWTPGLQSQQALSPERQARRGQSPTDPARRRADPHRSRSTRVPDRQHPPSRSTCCHGKRLSRMLVFGHVCLYNDASIDGGAEERRADAGRGLPRPLLGLSRGRAAMAILIRLSTIFGPILSSCKFPDSVDVPTFGTRGHTRPTCHRSQHRSNH